ncbi:uncharacterized protein [Rutidosis leptorrhynchoides]|uniref:uncharacterized protein n=1 Tax=Rutidosis leptorrhynchoides TaxID=125765 RepID=UPI003A99EB6B
MAFDIWTRVYKWWDLGSYTKLSLTESFGGNLTVAKTDLGAKIWQAVEWTCGYLLWKNRNNKVFKKKAWCAPSALNEIQITSFDWISHRVKGVHLEWHKWLANPKEYLLAR